MDEQDNYKKIICQKKERRASSGLSSTDTEANVPVYECNLSKENESQFAKHTASKKPSSSNGYYLKHYKILKLIGEGSFGKVFLVKDIKDDKLYAMKVLEKAEIIERGFAENTKLEQLILASVNHPNIVRLVTSFQTNTKLFLVLEYCPGNLNSLILLRRRDFLPSSGWQI